MNIRKVLIPIAISGLIPIAISGLIPIAISGPIPVALFPNNHGKNELTLGREEDNDIQLRLSNISRHHVKITDKQDGIVVQDLDSTNGTYVNGTKINTSTLQNGDTISFGRHLVYLFQVRKDEPAVSVPDAAPSKDVEKDK